jgi:MraZ protein
MFSGEYSHALDAKGRLTIPARFRDELEGGLVVTKGYEPCILLYPLSEWSALASKVAQLPKTNRAARAYSRLVFGSAAEVTLDKMGRILIPTFLREYAGIEEEAVVVGVNTYIEIWNPARWRATMEQDMENLADILDDVSQMGI